MLHIELIDKLSSRMNTMTYDPGACTLVAASIGPLLKRAHGLEERPLFPDFDRNAGSCFAAMMIERLKAEHRCDGLACEEMVHTLQTLAQGLPLAFQSVDRIGPDLRVLARVPGRDAF